MRLVIFGLTVSSSWGNGHATIWRGLCRALARKGHQVRFFERDVPYYAAHRDLQNSEPYQLILYSAWEEVEAQAREAVAAADSAIVTSYCPDALAAADLILDSPALVRVFYDLDTPVTLERLRLEGSVDYLPSYGLEPFDLVLSYAGGRALDELRQYLGARRVAALYVSHVPPPRHPAFYSSSKLTLSVTRAAMAEMGYCPSGRLFEAAACETPVLSDAWDGLQQFFEPGREILVASSASDVVEFLALSPEELRSIGCAARERVLAEHTAEHRSQQLLSLLEMAA